MKTTRILTVGFLVIAITQAVPIKTGEDEPIPPPNQELLPPKKSGVNYYDGPVSPPKYINDPLPSDWPIGWSSAYGPSGIFPFIPPQKFIDSGNDDIRVSYTDDPSLQVPTKPFTADEEGEKLSQGAIPPAPPSNAEEVHDLLSSGDYSHEEIEKAYPPEQPPDEETSHKAYEDLSINNGPGPEFYPQGDGAIYFSGKYYNPDQKDDPSRSEDRDYNTSYGKVVDQQYFPPGDSANQKPDEGEWNGHDPAGTEEAGNDPEGTGEAGDDTVDTEKAGEAGNDEGGSEN